MKNFALAGPGLSGTHWMLNCFEKIGLQRIFIPRRLHTSIAPKNSSCNVLYVYADPRNILLCAVSRSLERHPQPELRQKYGVNSDIDLWNHCNRMGGDKEFVEQNIDNINIERILNANYDPMKLEEHFTNWLTAPINYNLMMLKYEALANPKTYQKVLDFFS